MGDQIAPAVIKSQTKKTYKPHVCSDTFQMSEMQGQFGGVDTFYLNNTQL